MLHEVPFVSLFSHILIQFWNIQRLSEGHADEIFFDITSVYTSDLAICVAEILVCIIKMYLCN